MVCGGGEGGGGVTGWRAVCIVKAKRRARRARPTGAAAPWEKPEPLEKCRLVGAGEGVQADGGVAFRSEDATFAGALKIAFLDQERFVHFFEGLGLFAHGDGDGADADGAAAVVFGHDAEHAFVHFVEAGGVDFEELERGGGDGLGDTTVGALLGVVADEVDEIVGDAWGAAGARGDLSRAAGVDGDFQEIAGTVNDFLERGGVVVVEARLKRETRAERGGEEACAGGGADEGEAWDREADAAGVGALVDHDIEAEILHRGVEILLDGFRDAVDFVDEEDVAFLEIREEAGEVAGFFDDGAGGDADVFAELVAEDEGERGFAEAGRAGEENVVERFAALFGGADHDLETLDGFGLAGEVGEGERAERGFGGRDGCRERAGDVAETCRRGRRRDFRFLIFEFRLGHGEEARVGNRKSKIENRKSAHRHSTSAPRDFRFSTKLGWARLMVSALRTMDFPGMLAATM